MVMHKMNRTEQDKQYSSPEFERN